MKNWCGGVLTEEAERARDVAKACVARARQKWGKGWDHLSSEQQQGAVSSEVVQVMLRQVKQLPDTLEFLRSVAQWAYHAMEE